MSRATTFNVSLMVDLICSYTTMPLDVVKTRMQSIQGRSTYGNSLNCARLLLQTEGLRVFWSGSMARLGRLSLSGGIVFTM